SIRNKYEGLSKDKKENSSIILPSSIDNEINLMLEAVKFNDIIEHSYEENAPHRICQYIYNLANAFNSFYHDNKIIAEEDKEKQQSWINLITLVQGILETCIDLLGFEAPDRM
ncbi:MAG: arginine--tRNA ligase, partial [Clostridiales bacterium]|nr:arginine--tRNA ligase [Clostridiales bacterium]